MVITQLPAQRAALAEERRDWWRAAACLEADPELFFPVTAHGPGAREIVRIGLQAGGRPPPVAPFLRKRGALGW